MEREEGGRERREGGRERSERGTEREEGGREKSKKRNGEEEEEERVERFLPPGLRWFLQWMSSMVVLTQHPSRPPQENGYVGTHTHTHSHARTHAHTYIHARIHTHSFSLFQAEPQELNLVRTVLHHLLKVLMT